MRIFRSTYTILIAILLTLLIVMGCAPEEPELVATAAPTNIPPSPPSQTPTTTPVPPVPPESAATPQVPTPESTPAQDSTATPVPPVPPESTATPQVSTPESTPAQDSTATITPPVEADPTATPQLQTFNVGDTVRLGDLHITVNGVRASLGDNFWAPEKGAYFIYVDVTFRNEGDQPEVVSTLLQMEMRDAEGRSYDVDISAIASSGSSSLDGEITPGGSLRGEVGYQLPTSATDLTWHFSGDIFRLGQAIFSLGNVPVPVLPPGFTLDDPLPAGEVLIGSDGTEIRVLGIIPDARRQVAEENSFNDSPEEGMRFYMIRLEVGYPADASGSVNVAAWDFSLIGDNRVVYGGLVYSISCGVIPEPLGGEFGEGHEVFAGGRVEGNVCFEIPEAEDGLILIHEPGYGTGPRRFLSLSN